MANSSALAGLLDRAGHVFHLASQLGRTFQDERGSRGGLRQVDPTSWVRNQPTFNKYCAAILDLRYAMQNPPDGFAPVAQALMKAAGVAKQIRDGMQTADGETWAAFLDFFPELNSVAAAGREAIKEVTKAPRVDDPFAFVDQAAAKGSGIDTTPALPRPAQRFVESAARGIPSILANVEPKHDGTIELIASDLAKQLQDAGHTLAAAQWAIHETNQGGRLRTDVIEVEMPSIGIPGPGGMVWHGGERGTIAIPEGMPAPFDSFKVTATESLWTWWRSFETESTATDQLKLAKKPQADVALNLSTMAAGKGMLAHIDSLAASNTAMRNMLVDLGIKHAGGAAPGSIPTETALTVTPEAAPKRSTERGEGRAKVIAALTKHHRYADGGCLNQEPIGNNELAKAADVSPSTASAFFNYKFHGHAKYKTLCRDAGKLAAALKLLNDEFAPYHLLGDSSSNLAAHEEKNTDAE
jgi:hypothetical protein